jgi:lantibiotic modifying enzyme
MFLASLYSATGDEKYKSLAIRGLEYDLNKRFESEVGWLWKRFEGDAMVRPYWIHGSTGVGCAAIRIHQILGGDRYLEMARRIADDAYVKYSVSPGLFEGLAGIAEFMLDMFEATGEDVYRKRALDLAETILWFKVERNGEAAWPGRLLDRISFDYATGTAGIGLFLIRLLQPGGRFLMDAAWDLRRLA